MPFPDNKILIIDDEIDLVKIAKERIEANGYKIIWAKDGAEGVKKAVKEKPNLILLDILMPKKDGFDALKELKCNAFTKNIPVIMLTVKAEADAIFKAQELGAADYFIKTNDWQDLLKYIKRYII